MKKGEDKENPGKTVIDSTESTGNANDTTEAKASEEQNLTDEIKSAIKTESEKGKKEENSKESSKDKYVLIKRSELDSYKDKIKQLTDLTDDRKRILAEFDNYKKWIQKEKEQTCAYSSAEVIKKLLPVVDSFEQAIKNGKGTSAEDKGLLLIRNQLMSIIEKEGVRPIECLGKKYDPYSHDIIMQEESDKPEGTVIEELQKGYMFKDKVLRHSMVKAAKKKEGKESHEVKNGR
jgi:molecular chaperone GrpE